MTPINSNIRFPSLLALQAKAKSLSWIGFDHGSDERGYYVTGVVLDPKVQAHFDALDAKRKGNVPKARSEVKRVGPPKRDDGPCGAIRTWTRDNPQATKEQALAQFPDMNPATVKIQFRKVRLGEV